MASININNNGKIGKSINISGNNVVISGNELFVDGKKIDLPDAKEFNIQIEGSVDVLKIDNANLISVTGNVRDLGTTNGDVNVSGDIVNVNTVNGDVKGKHISGKVSTVNGDIINLGK